MNKKLVFIAFGFLAALLSLFLYWKGLPELKQFDYRLKDARFRIRGSVTPHKDVVVVALDHKSIKEVGRWPWSREITGRLIENLASYYGVKVTALDIVFSEPQNNSADKALAASIAKAGNVVMGYFFRDEPTELSDDLMAQLDSSKLKLVKIAEGVENIPLQEYPGLDVNILELGNDALDFGFFNATPDSDGLYRRSILLLLYNGNIYPSLPMKALQQYLGAEAMLDVKAWGVDSLQLGGLRIPSREDGTMALNFYGPAGSFNTVSAVDVINRAIPRDALRGKIAFVGATEVGIYDLRPTPFDATLPGIEIHATMAANALEKRFLRYDGFTQQLEIATIIGFPVLLGVLLAFAPGTMVGMVCVVTVTMFFSFFNYSMFNRLFHDMTLIYPLIAVALTYFISEAWRNLVVERKGKQLKKAFSSYVSPDLVKQIEKDPDKLVLGGEQRQISILFSDIRGFTTVSESLTPPELVKLLNEYLTPMTRIVLEEHGTLDKFIGDAVMALFNAPLDVPKHAEHSCRAALRMMAELKELNKRFAERGMNTLDIGIGINTGLAVVGNMGADIRFDYTAIGDSVNLASRLEGLNKYYGTHILVSEDTKTEITDPTFVFREVDRVKVKGKHLPVVMYELMISHHDILPKFDEALKMYRKREFEQAKKTFEELIIKAEDAPSRLYFARCDEYIADPPPVEWDGVYTAKSK